MPAVTYATIETSLCKWLHDVTGYPAIMNAQNAPQPQKPYFDVTLRTRDNPGPVAGAGLDEMRPTPVPGVVSWTKFRTLTVQVNCYSNSVTGDTHAAAIMTEAIESLALQSVQYALQNDAHLRVLPVQSPVNDISALLDTRGESRAVVEVTFNVVSALAENVSWIETLNDTLTVEPVPNLPSP